MDSDFIVSFVSVRRFRILIFWLGILFVQTLHAQSHVLRGEYWIERDPVSIIQPGRKDKVPGGLSEREEAAYQDFLDDVRWTISGMIYGFDFSWVPPARDRGINSELEITPVFLIPSEDSRLKFVYSIESDGLLFLGVEYTLDGTQQKRVDSWQSHVFPVAQGRGTSPYYFGNRREAVESAIREAVRGYLRVREFNRPGEIGGRIALSAFPQVSLDAGTIYALVKLRLSIDTIRHYSFD